MGTPKPRIDIVKVLSNAALDAMESCPVEDLTVNEVVSACYTLTKHVTVTLMEECDPSEIEKNRLNLITAIGELYAVVQPSKEFLN